MYKRSWLVFNYKYICINVICSNHRSYIQNINQWTQTCSLRSLHTSMHKTARRHDTLKRTRCYRPDEQFLKSNLLSDSLSDTQSTYIIMIHNKLYLYVTHHKLASKPDALLDHFLEASLHSYMPFS